ncbi:MAG: phage Gp37/Gp68 family protein [Hylemonella sp.]
MAENTKIEWCDHTQNFWIGCTKVSKACDRCYAEVSTPSRTMQVGWGPGVPRHRTAPSTWAMPKKWNDQHETFFAKHGRRQRVFALSLGDWLDNEVPIEWFVDMLEVVRTTPNLDWLLLTKRIGMWRKRLLEAISFIGGISQELATWINDWLDGKPPANVWLGITVSDQPEADRDIPKLLQVPAAKRLLSMEPLLGPVNLTDISDGHADSTIPLEYWVEGFDTEDSPPAVGHNCLTGERWQRFGEWYEDGQRIDWVIVGGESGPGARPMHPDWARSLRDQCTVAGVPFLFKQWGAWEPANKLPKDTLLPAKRWGYICEHGGPVDQGFGPFRNETAHHELMGNVGKKAAGRLLDGRTWDEVPE